MPIDTHAHYIPPQLIAAIKARGRDIGVALVPADGGKEALRFAYGFKVRPFFPRLVEPVADRLKWLDEQRLDRQIVGTWPDIFAYGLPREHGIAWHRMLNDTLTEWTADHSNRFDWISSVPLTDAEAAAAELERSLNAGAIGVIISANVEGTNIGELPLEPFWRKAEALGAPVLLHPVLATAVPRIGKFALGQIAHYTYDTTLGIGSLIMSGVFDRFPKLTFLMSHGGGTYPYLAGRFDVMHGRMDKVAQANVAKEPPSAYARRMTYDSIVHAPKALRFLIEIAGIENVLLGTDYSFPPADMEPLAMVQSAGLSKADSDAISDGNPRRVFTRMRR